MNGRFFFVTMWAACAVASASAGGDLTGTWGQAGGPNSNFQLTTDDPVPTAWSVSRGENIRWRTPLPNVGQSGIAVWGDRLFLTTFAPGEGVDGAGKKNFSAEIVGLCVDVADGAILWSVPIGGLVPGPMMYTYSDPTSPTPVTDGETVVFTNASGCIAAFDFEGNELWRKTWRPWGPAEHFPFNKMHEPILYDGTVINLEPPDDPGEEKFGWNYLRGRDLKTGETVWTAEHGSTSYVTSMFGFTPAGEPALMTGRGAVHDHPERPAGLNLVSLARGEAGKSEWLFLTPTDKFGKPAEPGTVVGRTWPAMYDCVWDDRYAYWFNLQPVESAVLLDIETGELAKKLSLIEDVDLRRWDPEQGRHRLLAGIHLRETPDWPDYLKVKGRRPPSIVVNPSPHSNVAAGGYYYFLCTTGNKRNRPPGVNGLAGPSHCVGRVDVETGKVEYFELPVTVVRERGEADRFVYGELVAVETRNAAGLDVSTESRTKEDGWKAPAYWGTPVVLNGNIYWTTTLGITYVIDADAAVLDPSAVVAINDLGPSGETWTLNSISYSDGVIYHRTSKELIAIGD